ncbi:MAG TPA: DNA gyrase inhibitor YacG [Stellaceae bacterium]|nr:DNA gyrase inhibitor YacG [Stellaceae bacterium]
MAKSNVGAPALPRSAAPRRCPICGRPASPLHQPFCSARCADIDLGRWLKGNYRVETEDAAPESADSEG